MRYMQLLNEGGNIFKDADGQIITRAITREEVPATLNWLEKLTKVPIRDNTIGSTGKKPTSGDIDVAVDAELTKKDDLYSKLLAWAATQPGTPKDWVRKSGISVHLKTPISGDPANGFVQTDFMFYHDIDFAKWMGAYDPNTQYKNADRIILMNSIAKHLGLKMSPDTGLVTRDTGRLISKDPDEIARIFIGPHAVRDDLNTVERIMAALATDPDREAKTADARDNFAMRGLDLDAAVGSDL
jgi:hypothetical protein